MGLFFLFLSLFLLGIPVIAMAKNISSPSTNSIEEKDDEFIKTLSDIIKGKIKVKNNGNIYYFKRKKHQVSFQCDGNVVSGAFINNDYTSFRYRTPITFTFNLKTGEITHEIYDSTVYQKNPDLFNSVIKLSNDIFPFYAKNKIKEPEKKYNVDKIGVFKEELENIYTVFKRIEEFGDEINIETKHYMETMVNKDIDHLLTSYGNCDPVQITIYKEQVRNTLIHMENELIHIENDLKRKHNEQNEYELKKSIETIRVRKNPLK